MEHKKYKLRVVLLTFLFFSGYLVIAGRIFFVQILQKDFFEELAKGQYQTTVTITPERGAVFDRNLKQVAFNQDSPSFFILPHKLKNREVVQLFLQKEYPDVYQRFMKDRAKKFLWLDRHISQERVQLLQQALGEDACCVYEPKRYYPLQAMASVLGFTDSDNNGLAGVELYHSKLLQGVPQTLTLERDARSRKFYFDKLDERPGVTGQPVILTIDSKLQLLAYEELKKTVEDFSAKLGSVLIMNPDTGEILAMANYPSFDPNNKITSEILPLTKNNIVTECYEFGSVMKIFTALAALQEKVVEFDEEIDCVGRFAYIDGFRIENPTISLLRLLEKNNYKLPFYQVVRYSSNVGMAKVAQRLGSKLYDHLRLCSFGSKTSIAFPGEREGFVNPPHNWSRPSVLVMSFGYEIMATILQLGVATSIIANGGYAVSPEISWSSEDANRQGHKRIYDEKPIAQIQDILAMIGSKFPIPGYTIKGKTGTARCLEDGKYSQKKHIYTFAGIVEKDSYRRVIVTFIKETERSHWWASQVSAPLFQKVAQQMVLYESMKTASDNAQ